MTRCEKLQRFIAKNAILIFVTKEILYLVTS